MLAYLIAKKHNDPHFETPSTTHFWAYDTNSKKALAQVKAFTDLKQEWLELVWSRPLCAHEHAMLERPHPRQG